MIRAAQTVLSLLAVFALPAAHAQITIGSTFPATGVSASLGIPGKNTMEVMPTSIAGQAVKYIVLDDGSDPAAAVKNMRKMIQEDKADVIIGTIATVGCLAMSEVALELKTAVLCPAPFPIRNPWMFSLAHPVPIMVEGIVAHMKANNVKTVAFIGHSDAWGDQNYDALVKFAPSAGIKVLTNERYARTDTSVSAQILKIMATNPDAVFVGGTGTPGALPSLALAERGYKGRAYNTHGVLNRDFLRVGGKAVEGVIAPASPFIVADQLPDSNPIKKLALAYKTSYEAKFGPGTANPFGAYTFDAYFWLNAAIPVALKQSKPGTAEFRAALRAALESLKDVVGVNSIYNLSPGNHNGMDQRSRVLVRVENGAFKLLP